MDFLSGKMQHCTTHNRIEVKKILKKVGPLLLLCSNCYFYCWKCRCNCNHWSRRYCHHLSCCYCRNRSCCGHCCCCVGCCHYIRSCTCATVDPESVRRHFYFHFRQKKPFWSCLTFRHIGLLTNWAENEISWLRFILWRFSLFNLVLLLPFYLSPWSPPPLSILSSAECFLPFSPISSFFRVSLPHSFVVSIFCLYLMLQWTFCFFSGSSICPTF